MASSSSSRVSSEHDDEQGPTRLSALYQYHNAPEVAPAHGLEYDDTVYPVSDKFPVIRETKFNHAHRYTGKHAYANDNKPPRIIFGMKVKTFLVVATVMILVVVGAAVGGAVGGKDLHQGTPQPGNYGDMSGGYSSSTSPTSTPTAAPTYSAATPTYTPLTGCPASSDNTTYTSSYSQSTTSNNPGLTFTMFCNLQSPLDASSTAQIAAAYVYSFADCVDVCASLNTQSDDSNCTTAVYKPASPRPANCWLGYTNGSIHASSLKDETGTEVAVLVGQS